jgi:hypothetical protein
MGVPRSSIGDEAYAWAMAQCRHVDAPLAYCISVVGSLIGECYADRLEAPPATQQGN